MRRRGMPWSRRNRSSVPSEGREENHLSQEQLADVTGIHQTNISKLESGTANPSLRTLKRLAAGMGMKLKLEFVPAQSGSGAR